MAASWGGKDSGFGLAKCCADSPIETFPESATTLHFEFYHENTGMTRQADVDVATMASFVTPVPTAAGAQGVSAAAAAAAAAAAKSAKQVPIVINIPNVDRASETPAQLMNR